MQKQIPLLIIGQGPAGLSAAIYAGRAGVPVIVTGRRSRSGGEHKVDNYFGFPDSITGGELLDRGIRQAQRFGVQVIDERVLSIHMTEAGHYRVKTEEQELEACALILATGIERHRPGIKNLADYEGKGVAYCVSCDGFFYRNRPVMVLGEGNFAAHQANELLSFTDNIRICTQGKPLDMDPGLQETLKEAGIKIIADRKAVHLEGEPNLGRVVFDDGSNEGVDGLFIAMGQARAADFANSLGLLMRGEFIEVDQRQQTNLPGVFAAGDCVGRYQQVSVAVGEGAIAARAAMQHVKAQCGVKRRTAPAVGGEDEKSPAPAA